MSTRKLTEKHNHGATLKAFSVEEINFIEEECRKIDPWYANFFRFAIATGLKANEILGITWHDVDLWKHREITIPDPKRPRERDAALRRIVIDENMLGILLDLRSNSRWVFQKTGLRMLSGTVSNFFKELSQKLNLTINAENLRWTFATQMHDRINPKSRQDWQEIQKVMGHRDISATKSYFHRHRLKLNKN